MRETSRKRKQVLLHVHPWLCNLCASGSRMCYVRGGPREWRHGVGGESSATQADVCCCWCVLTSVVCCLYKSHTGICRSSRASRGLYGCGCCGLGSSKQGCRGLGSSNEGMGNVATLRHLSGVGWCSSCAPAAVVASALCRQRACHVWLARGNERGCLFPAPLLCSCTCVP